jgi:hypothetical protein
MRAFGIHIAQGRPKKSRFVRMSDLKRRLKWQSGGIIRKDMERTEVGL